MTYVDQVRIVPITVEHLDEIVAMERRCFSDPWTRGMFRSEIELAGGTYARAALMAEALVGYSFAVIVSDEAHLGNLAVDPGYRRKGIAQALLLDLLTSARSQGIRRVTPVTSTHGTDSWTSRSGRATTATRSRMLS
jgi:ribosomal-protein-alanine N-acetyltransferase